MKHHMVLALVLLGACNRDAGDDQAAVTPTPAALTYEGADYKTEAEKVAHGKRLAIILDCTGCHGSNLQGTNLNDDPKQPPMYAPNITRLLANYSDPELDKLIRHGQPKDGREFWFMPVESYQFLSDADANAIVAYLRTFQPAGEASPAFRKNADFQKEIERGLVGNAREQIAKYRSAPPVDLGSKHAWGRSLAMTTCTACHNNALQGWEDFTPDLDIAGTYSKDELTKLLTTGEGKKPKLGMMGEIARDHFSKLTPREREAIVDYILARANRPQ